jgi:hypothetical protein
MRLSRIAGWAFGLNTPCARGDGLDDHGDRAAPFERGLEEVSSKSSRPL